MNAHMPASGAFAGVAPPSRPDGGLRASSDEGKGDSRGILRRDLLAAGAVGTAFVCLGAAGVAFGKEDGSRVLPPGAGSPRDLLALCNRCGRCIQACPQRVVVPTPLSKGVVAYGTPELVFDLGYCDFCMKCVDACPTGALAYGRPSEHDIGVAVVLKEACIAWNWSGCTVCYDECPVEGAISLDDLARPSVQEGLCTGCGKCELACPAASLRAYDAAVADKGIVVVSHENA